MKKLIFTILFIAFFPALAFGADSNLSKDYQLCLEKADNLTAAKLQCIYRETEIHDKRLNETYQKLRKILPEKRKKTLQDAQRAWIKFRDAYADFLNDPRGGDSSDLRRAGWLLNCTAQQADRLESEL